MRLLFVCTGNTCRSSMAEAVARRLAAERALHDLELGSAGTSAWEGSPASDGALLVAMEQGIDLNAHRARVLSKEIVAAADLVLVMSGHHRDRALALGGEGKTFLITDYASRSSLGSPVLDPFGGDLDTYRSTFAEMEREITRVLDRIAAEREAPER